MYIWISVSDIVSYTHFYLIWYIRNDITTLAFYDRHSSDSILSPPM